MTRTTTRRRRASDFRIKEGTKSFTPPRKRDYGFESSESDNGGGGMVCILWIMDKPTFLIRVHGWISLQIMGWDQIVLKEKKSRGKKGRCYLQTYNATNQAARIKV